MKMFRVECVVAGRAVTFRVLADARAARRQAEALADKMRASVNEHGLMTR